MDQPMATKRSATSSTRTSRGCRAPAARRAVAEGLSVRALEEMAKRANAERPAPRPARRIRYYDEAELALRDTLNRVVHVGGTKKKGVLTIEFYGEEDLKNLLSDLKLGD